MGLHSTQPKCPMIYTMDWAGVERRGARYRKSVTVDLREPSAPSLRSDLGRRRRLPPASESGETELYGGPTRFAIEGADLPVMQFHGPLSNG